MTHAWTLAGALIFAAVLRAQGPQIKVIAHASVGVSQISSEDLQGVFLETRTSLPNGGHVVPVLLSGGGVHAAFVRQYTGKTTVALANYYRSLVFTGKGAMPKILGSEAEMVEYVRKTVGAIGYVGAEASTEGVKVLNVD